MNALPGKEESKSAAPRKFRLAVVNSHPIQYFAPLYAYLNRDPAIEVTALYCSDFSMRGAIDPGFNRKVTWDVDLLSGYRAVFLGEGASRRTPAGYWSLVCPQLWSEIRSGQYDALWLHGYSYAADLLAFFAAKSMGMPIFMRSETHLGLRTKPWRRRVRDAALSIAYRFIDGFFAIGTLNRVYYRSLGVPEEKIFDVPYTVDNDRFIAAAALTPAQRAEVRRAHGLPEEGLVILYASKLTRRKHPDDLIRAVADLRVKGHVLTLFVVGAGEMEHELRSLAAALALDNVVFGGFINQAELPRIYAASDVFVLPSEHEPWGLIVNEVMCAGVPVVVADEVGCAPDLVKDGVNGFHSKARDSTSLAAALEILAVDGVRRREMGRAGLSLIRKWSYRECHAGITAAMRSGTAEALERGGASS